MENKIFRITGPIVLAVILGIVLIILLQSFINDIKSQKEKVLRKTQATCKANFPSQAIPHAYHYTPKLPPQLPTKFSHETISTTTLPENIRQCEMELSAIETLDIWSKSPPFAIIIWVIITFFTKLISKIADDCYSCTVCIVVCFVLAVFSGTALLFYR